MKHVRTKYYNDDRNGQIEWQAEYDGDKRDGLRESFYIDGSIWARSNYKNGERDGLYEEFREDGSVWERSNYKNDKLDGLREWFYEDGSVGVRSNWKNGVEIPLDDKVKLEPTALELLKQAITLLESQSLPTKGGIKK